MSLPAPLASLQVSRRQAGVATGDSLNRAGLELVGVYSFRNSSDSPAARLWKCCVGPRLRLTGLHSGSACLVGDWKRRASSPFPLGVGVPYSLEIGCARRGPPEVSELRAVQVGG